MEEEYSKIWILWLVIGIIILAIAVGIPWTCAGNTAVGPMDQYTLVYEGGPLDGRNYIKTEDPGAGRFWKGNLNNIYKYPSTQRTYIVAMEESVGDVKAADEIIINVKGANKIRLEIALSFRLVPENLRQFHELLGLKYSAWTDKGWDKMLEEQVRQPLETAFQEEGKQYTNIEACNEVGMTKMGDAVASVIQTRIDQYMNGHYIQVLSLSLTSAKPADEVQTEIEKIAASEQAIQTAQNNKLAAEKNAAANEILRKSLEGEGGMTAVLQKAVESGRVTFWVLPSDMKIVAPSVNTTPTVVPPVESVSGPTP